MNNLEIDVTVLKRAVNAVLDHLIEDLGLEKVAIDGREDFYWDFSAQEMYETSKKPAELTTGRLSDDMDFVRLVHRGQAADITYNLVHIAPLLQYIGEKVKR